MSSSFVKKLGQFQPVCVFILVGCIIGLAVIIAYPGTRTIRKEKVIDYTYCVDEDNGPCLDYVGTAPDICVCYHNFNLTESFEGKIVAYYELESFDQQRSDYVNSRDDDQLKGIMNLIPSENCEPYRYSEDRKPIAPCGRIADSLFNDTFIIQDLSNNAMFPYSTSEMLEEHEKINYRNPSNLSAVNVSFAKPKNWRKTVWELVTDNAESNGLQNEYFIGWMNTQLKRKPRARLLTQKLTSGAYRLRIGYNYPSSAYNGTRLFILTSYRSEINNNFHYKVIIIVLAIFFFIYLVTVSIVYGKCKCFKRITSNTDREKSQDTAAPSSPEEAASLTHRPQS